MHPVHRPELHTRKKKKPVEIRHYGALVVLTHKLFGKYIDAQGE